MNGKLLQPDILPEDVENDDKALKIFNRSGINGLPGIFNCNHLVRIKVPCKEAFTLTVRTR